MLTLAQVLLALDPEDWMVSLDLKTYTSTCQSCSPTEASLDLCFQFSILCFLNSGEKIYPGHAPLSKDALDHRRVQTPFVIH